MRKHTAATVGDDMYTEVILFVRHIGDLAVDGPGRRGHRPGQEQVRRGDQRAAAVPTLHRLHRRQNKTARRHARLMPNSHRQSRRDTDKTVFSSLAWRCELALRIFAS